MAKFKENVHKNIVVLNSSCEYLFHKYLQIELNTQKHNYLRELLNYKYKLLDNIFFSR